MCPDAHPRTRSPKKAIQHYGAYAKRYRKTKRDAEEVAFRVGVVREVSGDWGSGRLLTGTVSEPDFRDVQTAQTSFSHVAASATFVRRLALPSVTEMVIGESVSGSHFATLGVGAKLAAMRDRSHLDAPYQEGTRRVAELSGELDRLRGKLATDEAVSESLAEYADRLRAGERDQARAHISRAHRPASEDELRVSRVAEAWAAISVSLMLISFVGIAMFEREHLISMLVFSIAFFAFVEAGFRGRLVNLVSSANIGLAVVATLIIIYEFFWQLVVAAVLVVGLYVLWDNLRELRR